MTTHRPERVAEEIREWIARLVRDEVRDPRVGFVTVTGVEVSPDLKHARVFVSSLGPDEQRAAAVEGLNHAAAFLRRGLARRARLRFVPALSFLEDDSIERGFRVDRLLDRLEIEPAPENDQDERDPRD